MGGYRRSALGYLWRNIGPEAQAIDKQRHHAARLLDVEAIIKPECGTKRPAQGASTIVFGAVSPLLADIGGAYPKDSDISPLDDEPRRLTAESIPLDATSHSLDPDTAGP